MNVLTGYIARELLKGSFIALLLLLTLFDLFTFSDELDDIGKGSYGLQEVFYFITLTSPTVLYELMPASALLGSLFVLGAMGNHHELTAMRAAGLSIFGIIKAVMLAGAILVMIALLIGELVAPEAEQKAQILRATALHKRVLLKTQYGVWLREGRQFINIRKIEDSGTLANVNIYEVDDQQHLRRSKSASQAVFLGHEQWQLDTVAQSDISLQQVLATAKKQQIWNSTIAPDLLKVVVVNPDNLSLLDLATYIDFLKENQQKSHKYELAFWGRVVNPLVVFVMLLVSAPFVIGVKRGISAGARILIGVVIGMGFNILDITVGHIGLIYDLNAPLMAFLPSVTVLILALIAIRRLQ
jgi:lipopolysaccharide export system permease protein